jgi:outer membrane protein, heavy metal efflux system
VRVQLTRLVIMILCAAGARAQQPSVPADLSLAQAVDLALAGHPSIQAASARIRGTAGLQTQAGLRRNPELFVQTENWRFAGDPGFRPMQDLDFYAYLAQPVERGGKRMLRTEAARLDAQVAGLELEGLQWKIRQEVRLAFLRGLLAQKQLELMKENGQNFQQIIDYHKARVEQGAMAEADLIKVLLEQERLALSESAASLDAERARAELVRAMGIPGQQTVAHLTDVPAPASNGGPPVALAALVERSHSKRIEAQVADVQLARARAEVEVQKAAAKPDWNVLFGYKRTAGFDTVLGGISVPLSVFNRNEGNIVYSLSEVDRVEHSRRAIFAQIDAEIAAALTGMRRRSAMLGQLERGMVERADESWRISLAAYQQGGADLLRLLDAQRVRNEVRLLFTRTQIEYRMSQAELENAVGEENIVLAEGVLRVQQ